MKHISKYILITAAVAVMGSAQRIETIAGTGAPGFAGDGGDAKEALVDPRSLALDAAGDLYVLDYINNRVRRVSSGGIIRTVAGTGEVGVPAEGSAIRSPLLQVYGLSAGRDGRLYIAESTGLYALDTKGELRVVVGGRSVPLVDASGERVLFSDFLGIYRVEPSGGSSIVAGGDEPGDSGDGGPAVQARFQTISSMVTDRLGRVWVADAEAGKVRRFSPGGAIETVAGAEPGQLVKPVAIAVDAAGTLYIADAGALRVYRVPAGTNRVELFAGDGREESYGDGGPAVQASFAALSGIAAGCAGVDVSDVLRVRRIGLSNPLIALAGITETATGRPLLRSGGGFRIEGCHLAEALRRAVSSDGQPLPRKLGATQVFVDGVPVPLVEVDLTRIEAQLPAGTPGGVVSVRVEVDGKPAVEARVEVIP